MRPNHSEATLTNARGDVNGPGHADTRGNVDSVQGRRYDDAVEHEGSAKIRCAHCPHCGHEVAWYRNPHRPFCSLSCRLIDLGRWLDERHRIPGADFAGESTDDDDRPRGDG